MAKETEGIAAALITQGRHRFYISSVPSSVLGDSCFVTSRDEDQTKGFQRTLNEKRAEDIANYIDAGFGTIPTSVILSAQDDAELSYNSRSKTITFTPGPKAFKVIDGQHRIWGFKKASTSIRVPVVIFNNLSLSDEARLFIDINTKQKPVPKELVLDIQRLAQIDENPQVTINELFDIFHSSPDSPLLGKTSPSRKRANHISRVTFSAAIKPLLYLFDEKTPSRLYQVWAPYLFAVQYTIGNMNDPVDIGQPTVFRAYMQAFPELLQRAALKYGNTIDTDSWINMLQGAEKIRNTAFSRNISLAAQQIVLATKPNIRL